MLGLEEWVCCVWNQEGRAGAPTGAGRWLPTQHGRKSLSHRNKLFTQDIDPSFGGKERDAAKTVVDLQVGAP